MSPAAPDPRKVAPPSVRPRDVRPGMVVWNPYGGARGRAQVASEPRERPDGAIEFDTADGRTALFRPGFRALYLDTEATAQLSAGPEAGSGHHERPGQVQAHLTGSDPSTSTKKGPTMTVTNGDQPASVQTREEGHAYLADKFAGYGWTPEEMRAAEHTFGPESPVAGAMESRAAGRQAEAGEAEAGS
jgi:hypothetical protein